MQTYSGYYSSPIGTLVIQATEQAVLSVAFSGNIPRTSVQASQTEPSERTIPSEYAENSEHAEPCPMLKRCLDELDEYFSGRRTEFSVETTLQGSPFEKMVWRELQRIPFGATASYAEIAARLGNKRAIRAVGNAAAKNPVAILIPCHRMIGSGGALTGYAGGLARKEWLLQHEAGNPTQATLF